jgi:hypothetical protein
MAADEKAAMRELVMRGGPYTAGERRAVLDYCRADVDMLAALLPRMLPELLGRRRAATVALGHALLRGRYMAAAARMEWTGIPLDAGLLERIRGAWAGIKRELVAEVDAASACTTGSASGRSASPPTWPRTTSPGRGSRAARWPWTTTPSATWRRPTRGSSRCASCGTRSASCASRRWPSVGRPEPLPALAFRSRTGRNQPSNARFVFGPATWIRSLIRPEPGRALAYVDFASQEMGSPPRSRATRPCSRPTSRATST